ncbi:MAG: PorV/PorQ family protein [bacterium]
MKKWKSIIRISMMIVLVSGSMGAIEKKVAQTGLQFLKIDMSSRAAAMGGSYITINNDATSMFYNPAGLARMESTLDIFATKTQWFAGISYLGGGVAYNLGDWGTVGASWMTCDYGDDFIGTQYANTPSGYIETGNLNVTSYAGGFSYAKSLTNKFSIGAQVKYCYQQLGENFIDAAGTVRKNKVSGMAYDFGTIFYPGFKDFRIGMSIRNFSPEFKYENEGFELPLTFVIGASMDVLDLLGEHENPLLVSVDATHPRDYTERLHVGAEYTFMKMISFRAGYKYNYDNERFTAGIGFQQDLAGVGINIGYAYATMKYFDAVHRISIGMSY